jgi:hypothetical protein
MKEPPDYEPLLQDLFAPRDEAADTIREASLASAIASVAQRRRRRSVVMKCAAIGLLVCIGAILSSSPLVDEKRTVANVTPTPSSNLTTLADPNPLDAIPSRGVRIISEEQLLDYFPDRAVALVGPANNRRLVFLD